MTPRQNNEPGADAAGPPQTATDAPGAQETRPHRDDDLPSLRTDSRRLGRNQGTPEDRARQL